MVTVCGIIVLMQALIMVFELVSIIALQFSRLSNTILPLSTFNPTIASQFLRNKSPIYITDFGIVTEVIDLQ